MRVIDLLNKIANGEEVPIYFKVNNIKFKFEDEHQLYNDLCEDWIYLNDEVIMDEVEIIEEDKNIEKIKILNCDNYVKKDNYETILTMQEIALDIQTLRHKLDEIIDYLEEKE